jgi:hypothetical protein
MLIAMASARGHRMRQPLWWALLEKIRRLCLPVRRRHPSSAADAPGLRPFLDETFAAWPFTDAAVEIAPASPGVYLLYRSGRLVYIGVAVSGSGVRQELESHLRGAYGGCTQGASAFLYELTADPIGLHRQYLRAHRAQYGGRLPACNESQSGVS